MVTSSSSNIWKERKERRRKEGRNKGKKKGRKKGRLMTWFK
jgi:predicted transposase YdaD